MTCGVTFYKEELRTLKRARNPPLNKVGLKRGANVAFAFRRYTVWGFLGAWVSIRVSVRRGQ